MLGTEKNHCWTEITRGLPPYPRKHIKKAKNSQENKAKKHLKDLQRVLKCSFIVFELKIDSLNAATNLT